MRRVVLLLLGSVCCWFSTSDLQAHFLFIRINPHAEAGRSVEVFFSERAEAGDPRFIEKIAGTTLAMQTEPGQFRALTVHQGVDRLRAALPAADSVSVDGKLLYGVLTREVPFLLEYYPKAIAGDASELNGLQPNPKHPVEIMAIVKDDAVVLTLLQQGKPVPNAKFNVVDDDLVDEELQADENGNAVFHPADPGHYCVYTKVVVDRQGELAGTKYTEVRQFPTLAFHWPLVRTEADPQAVAMFQQAVAARAGWIDFPGFSADVAGSADGRAFVGTVTVSADGTVDLDLDEETAAEWVDEQLSSIVRHRQAQRPARSKPVLYFADNDVSHPLGRLLTFLGGRFASSYRVKDGQIRVVNRNFGDENITITVLNTTKNADGRHLPHLYTVQSWNAGDGSLAGARTVQNHWRRIANYDLPASVTESSASSTGLVVRNLELSNHRLLKNGDGK